MRATVARIFKGDIRNGFYQNLKKFKLNYLIFTTLVKFALKRQAGYTKVVMGKYTNVVYSDVVLDPSLRSASRTTTKGLRPELYEGARPKVGTIVQPRTCGNPKKFFAFGEIF